MKAIDDVRPSPIAGKWYPADPRRLAESVDRFIQDAGSPDVVGEVVAIMVPHAGHRFLWPGGWLCIRCGSGVSCAGRRLGVANALSISCGIADQRTCCLCHAFRPGTR